MIWSNLPISSSVTLMMSKSPLTMKDIIFTDSGGIHHGIGELALCTI